MGIENLEPIKVNLKYPKEGFASETVIIPLGGDKFVIALYDPFAEDANFGDLIEAGHLGGNKYELRRLLKKSTWIIKQLMINPNFLLTIRGKEFIKKIVNIGGYWEVMMGSIFIFALPPEQEEAIDEIIQYDFTFKTDLTNEETDNELGEIYQQLDEDEELQVKFGYEDLVREVYSSDEED